MAKYLKKVITEDSKKSAHLIQLYAYYMHNQNSEDKDFGDVMPGHGGFLDRIDSTLFVSPIIYYFLVYFPHVF